jgi:hypothetical protein
MKHLTDDEIQSYLQSGRLDRQRGVKNHLRICPDCQQQLLLYDKLGDIVISMDSEPIPNCFEKAVMKRLECTQRQRRITDLIVAAVALIGILTVGTAILLTPQLRQVVAGYLTDAWHGTIKLTPGSGVITESLAVPFFGVLLLALFAVIDRLIMATQRASRKVRV